MAFAVLPQHRPLTEDDLAQLPEDGLRYELIDGELLVSPSPARLHQRISVNLTLLLVGSTPPGHEVLAAPFDWRVNRFNVFVPDLMVMRIEDVTEKRLERPPVLAVEILSPSTRQRDLHLKKRAYEDAGLEWYWVIDPVEPSLSVFRLVDRRFVEQALATGDEELTVREPLDVVVVPSQLTRPASAR